MKYLKIEGNAKLSGSVEISGAKNAALPLLAAALLIKGKCTLTNLPLVSDIKTMLRLLENLGATYELNNHSVTIDSSNVFNTKALYDIVRKMRASILVLGPLLSRFKICEVSLPGGCAIGQRPIDMHLSALEKMGANIELVDGYVKASGELVGAKIHFDKISVGATENTILAAVYAKGVTTIINAACEPEIVNLCEFLVKAGVNIKGIGTNTIEITGVTKLNTDFTCEIIPDRIEAGTYLCAGAITKSNIEVKNIIPEHLGALLSKFDEMGIKYETLKNSIKVYSSDYKAANIKTSEYPGFPTDMQAQFMALCLKANGESIIDERLFENRFMHVSELNRMGANIKLNGHIANVKTSNLQGAEVMATDLRASSALILAALAANGTTNIHRIYHLERGYENLCEKLSKLGAKLVELKEEE
ncbi:MULTISPECIES: UDP-N-acetylglucosamine 1-carboxyvinyltransferase [unclassified Campylobacter]|uniref:UDP-N-acetylglucosamine 1-carboxyvinyltransferase n=1 Tax=unclassified Campylobacter TaxID=2593542 RepID=UPI001BD943C8|nr:MULTISPECIES: UDP-N-acetylglucosamine 1-carboxyvinyltransferase [unclassified Campylobacter]MBZ7977876.1 UDP-N-acetylglucosamine 1-carboxyvinyltransferase [Campylobacter sp. RM12654]MBZ7979845.1 UDP-N-acetylglucosamine 1-carboxyvinyltransferase [Campylobacter sp. RM12642]MBZ7982046.1 UDP-N-acetylglucosamine 1-carboxyvinyltransferase [Campylobacter sp. RM12640]MBZ7983493.1 UDP-N-acetylglucosamine 1-carboxyvinyltransferase [Campylobacter sp. RM12647]MBZ7988898.1 UDP-N-acetylglucosamine 1-carb